MFVGVVFEAMICFGGEQTLNVLKFEGHMNLIRLCILTAYGCNLN